MNHFSILGQKLMGCIVLLLILPIYSHACTIFILTDEDQTLFFSNEDYTNPNTYLWFVPEGKGHYGCGFVGFDNGQAQGGINSEGLAFDWWAGGYHPYEWDRTKPRATGSSSQRMLESCKNVDEAIEFYQTYAEPSFAHATIFIADKTGESVIIGSKDGKLFFNKSRQSRVLGAGASTFNEMFHKNPLVEINHGTEILKQCVTTGTFATKYSHIFDLKTGNIVLHRFEKQEVPAQLNLYNELQKGGHYYEIPRLKEQLKEAPQPLLLNMKRLILFDYQKILDSTPRGSALPVKLLSELSNGTIDTTQYIDGFWPNLYEDQAGIKAELAQLGELESVDVIHKESNNEEMVYAYVAIYAKGRILWKFYYNSSSLVEDFKFRAVALTGE